MPAAAHKLADGERLHLHHGPIDLILWANELAREEAYRRATKRFTTILDELVAELPMLRRPNPPPLKGCVARRMQAATAPFLPAFITPMAAVAGAVADEILAAMATVQGLTKAHVNNGGDVAFHLVGDQNITAAMPDGRISLTTEAPWRGMATSGWQGRSHSLGIADSVTVIAKTAAIADAAATLIANAVDVPNHPAILREPAKALAPDSDLGNQLVTTAVGPLAPQDISAALDAGLAEARHFQTRNLIASAHLALKGQTRTLSAVKELTHA